MPKFFKNRKSKANLAPWSTGLDQPVRYWSTVDVPSVAHAGSSSTEALYTGSAQTKEDVAAQNLRNMSNFFPANVQQFESGAKRCRDVAGQTGPVPPRYDLISPHAIRRLAQVYGEGAKKYGERNWEKGLPSEDLLNRVHAHLNQYMSGNKSEDHLGHALWNLAALIHFEEVPCPKPGTLIPVSPNEISSFSSSCRSSTPSWAWSGGYTAPTDPSTTGSR